MNSKKANKKKMGFNQIWALIFIPVASLIINIYLSEFQEVYGKESIVISIALIFSIILILYVCVCKVVNALNEHVAYHSVSDEIIKIAEDVSDRVLKRDVDGILSDKALSEYEKNCDASEIWLASNELIEEEDGGEFFASVERNLQRGIIYRMFYVETPMSDMKVYQLKNSHNNHPNFHCHKVDKELFYFLVAGVDFCIYNPFCTSHTGRIGYIGVTLPATSEMYNFEVNNALISAVAGRLIKYIG